MRVATAGDGLWGEMEGGVVFAMMKATDFCNLGCRYCYVPENQRQTNGHLEIRDLPLLFERMYEWQQFEESCGALEFSWSGGEVLSLPHEWWRDMLRIQKEVYSAGNYTFTIENSVQSNLTLLDEERFRLLKEYGVVIGTSMDGPKAVMDATRVYRDGRSAFDAMMERIEPLRLRYNFVPGVIVVLSGANIAHIDEIFDFFNERRMQFQINSYHFAPSSIASHRDLSYRPEEYLRAMCQLYDRWSTTTDAVDIANFRRATDFLLYGRCSVCRMDRTCVGRFYMVRWNGDVYPCNEFSGADFEQAYCYGNLLRQDWRDVRDHATRQLLFDRDHLILERGIDDECRECRYWRGCYGGCFHCALKQNYQQGGDCSPETIAALKDAEHCEITRGLYAHIEKRLRDAAKQYSLPVFLYPDRVDPNPQRRRGHFYAYQLQLRAASKIDPNVVRPSLSKPQAALLRGYVAGEDRVLFICCNDGCLPQAVGGVDAVADDWMWLDYREHGSDATDERWPGSHVCCSDLLTWEGWAQHEKWDRIVIALPYIHEGDVANLLSLCWRALADDGLMLLYTLTDLLAQQRLSDLSEHPELTDHERSGTTINCRGLSYMVLHGKHRPAGSHSKAPATAV